MPAEGVSGHFAQGAQRHGNGLPEDRLEQGLRSRQGHGTRVKLVTRHWQRSGRLNLRAQVPVSAHCVRFRLREASRLAILPDSGPAPPGFRAADTSPGQDPRHPIPVQIGLHLASLRRRFMTSHSHSSQSSAVLAVTGSGSRGPHSGRRSCQRSRSDFRALSPLSTLHVFSPQQTLVSLPDLRRLATVAYRPLL